MALKVFDGTLSGVPTQSGSNPGSSEFSEFIEIQPVGCLPAWSRCVAEFVLSKTEGSPSGGSGRADSANVSGKVKDPGSGSGSKIT